jgi:hypothetical protein
VDASDSQGGASTSPNSGKEKGNVVHHVVLNGREVLLEEDDVPCRGG